MQLRLLTVACVALASGCYSGVGAAPEVNDAWRGRQAVELEARLGRPRAVTPRPDGAQLTWTYGGEDYEEMLATAFVDQQGRVLQFESESVAAGIPDDANIRTGAVYGLSIGMGALDDANTSLPSLQAYIGGMIGPRFALLGAYTFVNGLEDDDYVHGHSWAFAVQHWPTARINIRGGAAMVLDTDAGDANPTFAFGGVGALSFAAVRAGMFVLDVRLDATISQQGAFGLVSVGVNVN